MNKAYSQLKKTVLLVDDNDIIRTLIEDVLSTDGYNVLVAPNGSEALLAFDDHKNEIDLLITDLTMPEMDGRELAAHISSGYPNVRIIFMSGCPDLDLAGSDINEHPPLLVKPFSLKILREKVRELLADGRPTEA